MKNMPRIHTAPFRKLTSIVQILVGQAKRRRMWGKGLPPFCTVSLPEKGGAGGVEKNGNTGIWESSGESRLPQIRQREKACVTFSSMLSKEGSDQEEEPCDHTPPDPLPGSPEILPAWPSTYHLGNHRTHTIGGPSARPQHSPFYPPSEHKPPSPDTDNSPRPSTTTGVPSSSP